MYIRVYFKDSNNKYFVPLYEQERDTDPIKWLNSDGTTITRADSTPPTYYHNAYRSAMRVVKQKYRVIRKINPMPRRVYACIGVFEIAEK